MIFLEFKVTKLTVLKIFCQTPNSKKFKEITKKKFTRQNKSKIKFLA